MRPVSVEALHISSSTCFTGATLVGLSLTRRLRARACGRPGSTPGQVVTVHVADQTITINLDLDLDLDDKDCRTVRRTTAQPVRSIKAAQSRKDFGVS